MLSDGAEGESQVIVTSQVARLVPEVLRSLAEHQLVVVERLDLANSPEDVHRLAALANAWAVVAGAERYSEASFTALPKLRVIARPGVGYDSIDLEAATRHGVAVFTTPGANVDSVADFTLALILALIRRPHELDALIRAGGWRPVNAYPDLHAATVGIVGLGAIGRAVAQRLYGFGCRLLATEPYPDLEYCRRYGVSLVALEDLLPQIDILTLHTPLMASTLQLIGRRQLSLLRQTAVLVNTARGELVDEDALADALVSGRLAGAAVDVFAHEPLPQGHPLRAAPNAVLSGHVASLTIGGARAMLQAVVAGIIDLQRSNRPVGLLNPAVLDLWAVT